MSYPVRIPIVLGCAHILDEWEVQDDGSLFYRFSVDFNKAASLTSYDLHELTKLRKALRRSIG
jgi:hypothetical protein